MPVFDLNRVVQFGPQDNGGIGSSNPNQALARPDFGRPGGGYNPDLNQYPARVISEQAQDPSSGIPGSPPNFGRDMVPHIYTVQGRVGTISRVYRPADEAIRNSLEDARYMRNECGIMECLEARQRGTALLKWHLEPEDAKDPAQEQLCEDLTHIIDRIPHFLEYRRNLLEALWYGKYAIAHIWGMEMVGGRYRKTIKRWSPRHGDKLVFRYDDGTWAYDPSQIGIRIGAGYQTEDKGPDFLGGQRRKIEPTDQGLAYFLDAWEREKLMAVHQHIIEDGAYEYPLQAGAVTGVGIRSRIYWTWYQMQECLAFLLDYIERSALGVEIWRFPAGNPKAEEKTRTAAEERIGGGRSIILVPVPQGEDSHLYDVQHIEPGMAGANAVRELIEGYFAHKIKRYILGQILTSEAEATGLGSGVADAHLGTYADIIRYDAVKLGETLTTDLVRPLKAENFPRYRDCHIRFVIDTEEADSDEKLGAYEKAWNMGLEVKAEDVRQLIGSSRPSPDDETLQNPQFNQPGMPGMMGGAQGIGMDFAPPGSPQDQAKDVAQLQEGLANPGQEAPELYPENVAQFAQEQFAAQEFNTADRGGPDPFVFVKDSKQAYSRIEREQTTNGGFHYTFFNPGRYAVTIEGGKVVYAKKPNKGQLTFNWNEEDHPRDPDGKFAEKEGGGTATKPKRTKEQIQGEIADLAWQLDGADELEYEIIEADIRALEEELEGLDKEPKPGEEEPGPETEPETPPETEKPGDTQETAEEEPEPATPAATETATNEAPPATPRGEAEAKARELDEDYEFARKSAIPNAGEDLKGSARHIRNQWTDLETAEKEGTAEELVTRDNLFKNEPHDLAASAEDNALTALAMYWGLKKFPKTPGYRDDGGDAKDREQYLDAYRRIKDKAEELARNEENPIAAIKELRSEIAQTVRDLRGIEGTGLIAMSAATDPYNKTANSLIATQNALKTYGRGGIMKDFNNFGKQMEAAYGAIPGDDESLEAKQEYMANLTSHAIDVMEGMSVNKAFGKTGGGAKKWSSADAYVKHAERVGGPAIDADSANKAVSHMTETQGMRGIQWGNSVSDEERDHHAKMSAEAFLDLTDVLGLPESAASLDGTLGLAIGARGRSGAMAHYEPTSKVINLTRKNGVGSLAHEWGHFFDHHLGGHEIKTKGTGKRAKQSAAYYSQKDVRSTDDPMANAFRGLRNAMKESGYMKQAAQEAARQSNPNYWTSREEMFARCFEQHIQHKLRQDGRKNTYLAGSNGHPLWPTNEQSAQMAPHFDAIFEAYKSKE